MIEIQTKKVEPQKTEAKEIVLKPSKETQNFLNLLFDLIYSEKSKV